MHLGGIFEKQITLYPWINYVDDGEEKVLVSFWHWVTFKGILFSDFTLFSDFALLSKSPKIAFFQKALVKKFWLKAYFDLWAIQNLWDIAI